MSQNLFKANWEPDLSLQDLPIEHLLENKIRAIILDVDGTLLCGRNIILNDSVKSWINRANKNLVIHLLSNNPSKKRIGAVAEQLNLSFTYGASKPRRRSLKNVLDKMQLKPETVAMVGDRIFTDVLAGNRLNLYTVLVQPIGEDGQSKNNSKVRLVEKAVSRLLGAK